MEVGREGVEKRKRKKEERGEEGLSLSHSFFLSLTHYTISTNSL
jgi:hypothetical protein